ILGAALFAHWVLDVIVHRPELPLLPGNAGELPRIGLGLWDAPAIAVVLEAVILLGGVWLYWRSAPKSWPGGRPGASQRSATTAVLLLIAGVGVLVAHVLI